MTVPDSLCADNVNGKELSQSHQNIDQAALRPSQSFMGVANSLSGKNWYQRGILVQNGKFDTSQQQAIDRIGLALAQAFDLPEIIGRLLALRGIDLDRAESFLNPSLRRDLPDPSLFIDLDKAAKRLGDAVQNNEKIAVLGDYDVDGGTSSALFLRYARCLNIDISVTIPDRLTEGYGPNIKRIDEIAGSGAKILLMLDCGTTAHDAVAHANSRGLTVIICDHHISETLLPDAFAVINPNRLDHPPGFGDLAAVGVSFMVLVGLNRELRQRGFFKAASPEPDLRNFLDLVALGTVCDVMKLRGLNRTFVALGLKILQKRQNIGIRNLYDRAGIKDAPSTYHLGYILGPRLNAGGRIGACDLAVKLLSTESESEAAELAEKLSVLNQERQAIETELLNDALWQCETRKLAPPIILIWGENWHAGVIGVVAARLKERFNCPCLVASVGEDGTVKGSGRSVPGFDLGSAIVAARQLGLLTTGGGHKMAAGFGGLADKMPELQQFLTERMTRQLGGGGSSDDDIIAENAEILRQNLRPQLAIDAALHGDAANAELVTTLARMEPFGTGNSEPRFVLVNLRVKNSLIVGENHVKVSFTTGATGGKIINAIAFRAVGGELGRVLLEDHRGAALHVAGKLRIDRWQGSDKIQFIIDDAAFA